MGEENMNPVLKQIIFSLTVVSLSNEGVITSAVCEDETGGGTGFVCAGGLGVPVTTGGVTPELPDVVQLTTHPVRLSGSRIGRRILSGFFKWSAL
jgi:hypothetical protein